MDDRCDLLEQLMVQQRILKGDRLLPGIGVSDR